MKRISFLFTRIIKLSYKISFLNKKFLFTVKDSNGNVIGECEPYSYFPSKSSSLLESINATGDG